MPIPTRSFPASTNSMFALLLLSTRKSKSMPPSLITVSVPVKRILSCKVPPTMCFITKVASSVPSEASANMEFNLTPSTSSAASLLNKKRIRPKVSESAGLPLSRFKSNIGPTLPSASVDFSVSCGLLSAVAKVAVPVVEILPVPVILLLFRSRLPPSWGLESLTISDNPPDVSASN